MKRIHLFPWFLCLLLLACGESNNKKTNDSDVKNTPLTTAETTLYYNGDIITMEGNQPQYAEAVVSKNGEIAFVGKLSDAQKQFPAATKMDLQGKTLLPGFLDGHGHMANVGVVAQVANLLPPPDGPGANFESIITTLNNWKNTAEGKSFIAKIGWIVGNGYDDSQLQEKDHPKADDLDKVSTELPVLIIHQSGHLGVANHKALTLMGYIGNIENPKEGALRRNADGSPNGVLEENAFFQVLFGKVIGNFDAEMMTKSIQLGQEEYAKNGYLTAQEGRASISQVHALEDAATKKELFIDVVAYPDMRVNGSYELLDNTNFYNHDHRYNNHFRIGGMKLTLDGSPQGKTAWLTQHYLIPPDGKTADYRGYPIMSDAEADKSVEDAFKNHWQIICHTNGDAAIDQYLNAIEKAEAKYNYPDHRTVIIHGQTMRKDQIARAAKLKVDASLFPMHTFYWGDWHVQSVLGHPRADYISPTRDALNAGLNVTSHHDAPVTFPNSMRVLDATVNRVTRSGKILGPDQRLTPYEGLETLTSWAAHQYFEEKNKGTLTVGKVADLVILDKNPLKIDPMKIHDIKVLESIKEGNPVYTLK
ncbi:MAG: amidohydrolase [Bacteroidetes bacterium]|nr:amidohydrolase [Bacteroidota bacterium]